MSDSNLLEEVRRLTSALAFIHKEQERLTVELETLEDVLRRYQNVLPHGLKAELNKTGTFALAGLE